jgi:hypothetical protein
LFLVIVAAAWLINVFLSAQMVDQSQGRLRNPAEAVFILFVAMAVMEWRHGADRRPGGTVSPFSAR